MWSIIACKVSCMSWKEGGSISPKSYAADAHASGHRTPTFSPSRPVVLYTSIHNLYMYRRSVYVLSHCPLLSIIILSSTFVVSTVWKQIYFILFGFTTSVESLKHHRKLVVLITIATKHLLILLKSFAVDPKRKG